MDGDKTRAAGRILLVVLALDAVSALAKVIACETKTVGAPAAYCASQSGTISELTGTLRMLLDALDNEKEEPSPPPLPPPPEVPKAVMDQLKQRGRL